MNAEVRILLVEDNSSDAMTVKKCLSGQDDAVFHLHTVERLQHALEFLGRESCDLVMLNPFLPDSQGAGTLAAIRARAPETPVIVLTGSEDEPAAVQAMQGGARDSLVKSALQPSLVRKSIHYAIERHQMERSLMRTEKLRALGTLAGGIAHDFNNLLLLVSGNAKLALEELPEEHPARTSVLEIAKASGRGAALTRKILSFSGQQEFRRQPTHVQPVVEEALCLVRPSLPVEIEIHRDFATNLPAVMADASQIHQAVTNLVANAADAIGGRPGRLEVSARLVHMNGNGSNLSSKLTSGDYVKLSIQDDGPGMDKATMSRVFEPFFTTKPQGQGTGMGLAIVYGIMTSHAGAVTVYSEEGKGAIFNLYFPATDQVAAEERASTPAPRGEGQHILYVDDEEGLVLLVSRVLKRLGYRVSGFTNTFEALRALRETPSEFQAVVTDLSMPEMSGTEFAREALEICPNMPVIVTSGFIRPRDEELSRQIGVRELILKPDTVEELGEALHRLLAPAKDTTGTCP